MRGFCKLFLKLSIILFSTGISSQVLFKHIEEEVGFKNLKENTGVAVADFDGDFDLDIFIVAKGKDEDDIAKSHSKLYRNNGDGTYTDVTKGSGLENLLKFDELDASYDDFQGVSGYKFGVSWGDYDNDGDPDIFFTFLTKVLLFRNEGNGTFKNITTQSGIQEINGCSNSGATWFDYNNDRFLDLYISDWNGCSSNRLYKNNGNGTFSDVSEVTNIKTTDPLYSFRAMPFDFNNDGWMDLYVSNDFGKSNNLFINNEGKSFTDKAESYQVATKFNDMGIAISDYNKDGLFDVFVTAVGNNSLLTNNGNGTFTNRAVEQNVENSAWAWGARFADFDLDGDEDLIVASGFQVISDGSSHANDRSHQNFYFENSFENGINSFSQRFDLGIGQVKNTSIEVLDFDYDNDGDLDVFISNTDGDSFFYKNTSFFKPLNERHKWFKIILEGTLSNRDAVGTIVTITTENDVLKRYYSGIGFLGQSNKPVHFGLKDADKIVELKIEWPSGHIDVYENLAPNTFIKAIENKNYEEVVIMKPQEILGCTNPNSCNYNPDATMNDGSCVFLSDSGSISGDNTPSYFTTQTYTFPLQAGMSLDWHVEGGEIIENDSSGKITVKWAFEDDSKVTAIVDNGNCREEIQLKINFRLEGVLANRSIARLWNEALLDAIRNDYARPTVHARNLFHTSIAMYDAWAIYSETAKPYLIGNNVNGFSSQLVLFTPQEKTIEDSRKAAISYAAYRLLTHRFKNSPGAESSLKKFDLLMHQLGYDCDDNRIDYKENGSAVALGNFIAKTIIDYGAIDGSREQTDYDNAYYEPVNESLAPELGGNPTLTDPNRWQSLSLDVFIDQSGNIVDQSEKIDFLSPEWGNVWSFALSEDAKSVYERGGNIFNVYHDPNSPPYLDASNIASSKAYKDGFSQVSIWESHLDPTDGVMWDISPKKIGNIDISTFPKTYEEYTEFYKIIDGGDSSIGHAINPVTGSAYQSQMVPRGDYARVLAEFWADGPDSETPPGHWFTLLNYVSDHPLFVKKFEGEGEVLSHLEWDVKSYFILGGGMHDSAISAWSIKGWYDYIRPISAIRYLTGLGQSTDISLSNYHQDGIPLKEGHVEVVKEKDPLAGRQNEHVGKIKLYTWRGHNFINNPSTDQAGVGWILAENWWPYQRPSFVTPPFAGFVSGHSTFSRAAAEMMTLLTGDAYFPGGMGEFVAKKNEFLVFEEGPSMDIVLQWATYRDASDQCSLSRIWGGIHPPADDIPGRLIGEKIGIDAFNFAKSYFDGKEQRVLIGKGVTMYPSLISANEEITIAGATAEDKFLLSAINGKPISVKQRYNEANEVMKIQLGNVASGIYILTDNKGRNWKIVVK